MRAIVLPLALGTCVVSCSPTAARPPVDLETPAVQALVDAVSASEVERHMRVLAHDSLAGRAPGTPGFEGASRYVEAVFSELGIEPAGVDGFRQPVALRAGVVDEAGSSLHLAGSGGDVTLRYAEDYTLAPLLDEQESEVRGRVVFVGYGVSAPDLDYDDYAGVDVEGRIVALMSGAPPIFPSTQRAYHSSGAVKRAEAAERGAIGMITFTSPEDPRFRWEVGVARARRGGFTWLDGEGRPRGSSAGADFRGSATLNHGAAAQLFAQAPVSLADVFEAAAASTPQAFPLPVEATLRTVTRTRPVASHNLVARIPGSDPELQAEHVSYVAHLDHFGVGQPADGDSIYNGAHDNASGVAILLEIARAFSSLSDPPSRSLLFLVVTAEEWGLLGSDYFVQEPTVTRASLVANLSLDMPFLFHPLLDVVPYGAEHSTLSASIEAAADRLDIGIGPDPIPEQVLFIRSDHYSFVRAGIPALFIKSGFETGDERDGGALNTAFRRDRYHTPFDELDQGFDFDAGAAHARLNALTGYHVAMTPERPQWNPDDFFGEVFGARGR